MATSLGLHPTDFGVSPEFQKEQDRKADGIISQRNAQEARYGDSIRASKQMPPDPKPAPSTPAKPSSPPPKADKKAPPPAKPRDEDSAVWASKQMPADDPNAPRTPMEASKQSPAEVERIIGNTPGWSVEALGRGSHRGQGWVLREYTAEGNPAGRMLRWHPGGGHHGPDPYWRVTDYNSRSGEIR